MSVALLRPDSPTRPDTAQTMFDHALAEYDCVHKTRMESFMAYWQPLHRSFAEWVVVYPILRQIQLRTAQISIGWILDDSDSDRIHWRPLIRGEQSQDVYPFQLQPDVFWHFYDFDKGTKIRMTGKAAAQIECGYQWIKNRRYKIPKSVSRGVFATLGVYDELLVKTGVSYKLSYRVMEGAERGSKHISVHQYNAKTGFSRSLERFPPESTPARESFRSNMEVFLLQKMVKPDVTVVDFFVREGSWHMNGNWGSSMIRFLIDSSLSKNRERVCDGLMDLWRNDKLVGISDVSNVRLRDDARGFRRFVLDHDDGHELPAPPGGPPGGLSRLAMMAFMTDLLDAKDDISLETAAFSTKQHFGLSFLRKFRSDTDIVTQHSRLWNGHFVLGTEPVSFDLHRLTTAVFELFHRDVQLETQSRCRWSLNVICETGNENCIKFCAIDCQTEETQLEGVVEPDSDAICRYVSPETPTHPTFADSVDRLLLRDRSRSPSVEDAILETVIGLTRDSRDKLVMTTFPFDADHVYIFRNGCGKRLNIEEAVPFLSRLSRIDTSGDREIDEWEILSVETFRDGTVKYGCRDIGESKMELRRMEYEEIIAVRLNQWLLREDTDEKEIEEKELESNSIVECVGMSEEETVNEHARLWATFLDWKPEDRRSETSFWEEIVSYCVDERTQAFPIIAGFRRIEDLVAQCADVRVLIRDESETEVEMSRVVAAISICHQRRSICGVVVRNGLVSLFEIIEKQETRIDPAILLTVDGPFLEVNGDRYELGSLGIGPKVLVHLAECDLMTDKEVLDENMVSKLERIVSELHEWHSGRLRIGRRGHFAVFVTQSESFDFLEERVKKETSEVLNPKYDRHMSFFDTFEMTVWKRFTAEHDDDTLFVLVLDHDVFTLRCVDVHVADRSRDGVFASIVSSYYSSSSHQTHFEAFLYCDDDVCVNVREEVTSRGFFVPLVVHTHSNFSCPVCLSTKDSIAQLSCGHSLCHHCIRCTMFAHNTKCPLCRHDMMHPFMVPRPNRCSKDALHRFYGHMFRRSLRLTSFRDNLIWNTQYVDRSSNS